MDGWMERWNGCLLDEAEGLECACRCHAADWMDFFMQCRGLLGLCFYLCVCFIYVRV